MHTALNRWAVGLAVVTIVFFGAIFGFFFLFLSSTLRRLAHIDPRSAIDAVNGMNESV